MPQVSAVHKMLANVELEIQAERRDIWHCAVHRVHLFLSWMQTLLIADGRFFHEIGRNKTDVSHKLREVQGQGMNNTDSHE